MLTAGLFIASCHDTDIESTYSGTQKISAYDQAFKEAFGTPAPNHSWGFSKGDPSPTYSSTRAMTRGHNKESNQWVSQGWVVPDPLTSEQKDKVRRFFQQNQNPRGISLNYENFFVQQVYKGGDNTNGSKTTETYLRGNLSSVTGSDHMDKLTAGSIEDHINDFNNGNRGEINVQNNDKSGEHQDAITLMVNSKTDCFGYHNSDDSKQYNDKFIIIPGSTIDAWDSSEPSVTGMFFVGFDYEANKAAYNYDGTLNVNSNQYLVTETTANDPLGVTLPNDNSGRKYLIGGADGYYSDWIVRITKGVNLNDNTGNIDTGDKHDDDAGLDMFWRRTTWEAVESGRVFCEDLGGEYSTSMDDFDFNDIVFDAVIWKTQDFFYQEKKIQDTWEEGTPLAGQLKFEQKEDPNSPDGLAYEYLTDEAGNIIYNKMTVTEQQTVKRVDGNGNPVLDENGQEIWDTVNVEVEVDDPSSPQYDTTKPIYDEEKPVWKKDANGDFEHEPEELENYRSAPKYQAEIALLATGATEPATVVGEEVHNAFGVGPKVMVNTVGSTAEVNGTYTDADPVYLGKYDIATSSINDIDVVVLYGTAHESGASILKSGEGYAGAPQKFQVNIGTPWMQERFGILLGYPAFKDWVGDSTMPSSAWTNSTEEGKERQPFYLYEQSWPNILSTTYYEDKTVIDESQLGETGAPSKGGSSDGTPKTPSNMTTKWSKGSDYGYQEHITANDLSNAGVVDTKGANLVVSGTHRANCWGVSLIWGDWSGTFFTANNGYNSQYGVVNDLTKEGDEIVVTLPISQEEMTKIMQVGLRVGCDNITISSIEIKQ